jgi:hypothetical protein
MFGFNLGLDLVKKKRKFPSGKRTVVINLKIAVANAEPIV